MLKKIAGKVFRKIPRQLRKRLVRLTQDKFTASVAAIVFNRDGEVLLLDHVLRPQSGWAIPGGFINSAEQPVEAVKREIREETGLNLAEVELLRVRVVGKHIEFIFRAEAVGKAEVKSLEINAVGWFSVADLPEQMREVEKKMIKELPPKSS